MQASSAVHPSAQTRNTFEIKSAQLPTVALLVKSADLSKLAEELHSAYGPDGESPDFLNGMELFSTFLRYQQMKPHRI